MLKIAAIVSLMLIGSTLWAAGLSCESCGRECTASCGTRHFRACCFNYLRKKRQSIETDINKLWIPKIQKPDEIAKTSKRIPIFAIENVEPWVNNVAPGSEYEPFGFEDIAVNRLPFDHFD